MKNITFFFFAFFFLAFFNAANSQSGGQSPVSGLGYAPDSNYVIYSQFYKGRNGVALWVHKDSINWWTPNDSIITPNDSIIYVGIGGNDATAIKGSRIKYWRTIDAALSAASEKDLIYHFTQDTQTINTGNHPWVSIISIGAIANNGISSLFTGNPPSGNFVFSFNEYTGRRFVTAAAAVTDTAFIAFSCNKCTSIPSNLSKYGAYDIETMINPTEINGGQMLPQLAEGRQTSIHIGNLKSDYQFQNNALLWASFGDDAGQTNSNHSTLNIKIDNADIFAKTRNIGLFYSYWTNASGDYNTNLKLDVGNVSYKSIYTTTDISPYSLYATITTNAPNSLGVFNPGQLPGSSQNTLNLQNVYSEGPVGLGRSAQKVNIKGRFPRTRAIDIVEAITAKCEISLNVVCDSSHVVSVLNGTTGNGEIIVSGRMETKKAATGVIYSTKDFYLENAELINDGATPAIIAPTPITVYVRGDLYMNSDSIDPDVTFRKIEYGYSYPRASQKWDTQTIIDSLYLAFTSGTDGNGIISALPAGNVAINAASHNLDITSAGNITQTGSGSATYRFNLYPSSSLPVLLEQTSAGDTAYLQLRASLGRATLRATQDIYLEAANSVFVSTLEGSSTGIVSARPTGELIRRERAFVNASINTDTFTVALSPTEINLPFNDDVSEGFNVSGDSLIYTGTDTAYFEIGYQQNIEFLESATGTYRLNLSVYQNGVNIPRSEMEHLIYFRNTTTEPILTAGKTFIVQLINGDVLNIRQNGTTGINAAIHNLSITANKIE